MGRVEWQAKSFRQLPAVSSREASMAIRCYRCLVETISYKMINVEEARDACNQLKEQNRKTKVKRSGFVRSYAYYGIQPIVIVFQRIEPIT